MELTAAWFSLAQKDVGRHRYSCRRDRRLRSRLRDKAHWLLWEAGKGLAILLLALAGGHGMWGAQGGVLLEGTLSPGWLGCSVPGKTCLVHEGRVFRPRGRLSAWREGCLVQRGKQSKEKGCLVWEGECSIQGRNLNPGGELLTPRVK